MAAGAVLLAVPLLLSVLSSGAAASSRSARQAAAPPACISEVDGLPLRVEDRFADTVRSFAGGDGEPTHSSLLCPYGNRAATSPQLSLTLEWALEEGAQVGCDDSNAELETAEGRTTGVISDPQRRAQVRIEAEPDLAEAATAGATSLLALAPSDTAACADGAAAPAGSADDDGGGSSPVLPILIVLLVLGGGGFLVVELVRLGARLASRRREYTGAPEPSGLTAAAADVAGCAERVRVLDEEIAGLERDLEGATAAAAVSTTALRPLLDAHTRRSEVGFLDSAGGRLTLIAAACDLFARLPRQGAQERSPDEARAAARITAELADRLERASTRTTGSSTEVASALGDGARALATAARTANADLASGVTPADLVGGLDRQRSTVLLAIAVALAGVGLSDTRYWLWSVERRGLDRLLQALGERATLEAAGRGPSGPHAARAGIEARLAALRSERARVAAECEELERSVVHDQRRGQMTP